MNEVIVAGQTIQAGDNPMVVYRDHLYLYLNRLGFSPRSVKLTWAEAQLVANVVRQLEGCPCGRKDRKDA